MTHRRKTKGGRRALQGLAAAASTMHVAKVAAQKRQEGARRPQGEKGGLIAVDEAAVRSVTLHPMSGNFPAGTPVEVTRGGDEAA